LTTIDDAPDTRNAAGPASEVYDFKQPDSEKSKSPKRNGSLTIAPTVGCTFSSLEQARFLACFVRRLRRPGSLVRQPGTALPVHFFK
jgi:hypothetical protein